MKNIFKNVQKKQYEQLMLKECTACGEKGFTRFSCIDRKFCHSSVDGCLKSKHNPGDAKFPCGKTCSVCDGFGHDDKNCRSKPVFRQCDVCCVCQKQHGGICYAEKATKIYCSFCDRDTHQTQECKYVCVAKECKDLVKHRFGDEEYPCSIRCSMCEKLGHKPETCRLVCRAKWCSSEAGPHLFGASNEFMCGVKCLICERMGHEGASCGYACRAKRCSKLEKHLFKDEQFPCSGNNSLSGFKVVGKKS